MRLDRLSGLAVDRQYVLRTGGERDHQIHFGAQAYMASGHRTRWSLETKRAFRRPRNVHEQVERARNFRRNEAELGHRRQEIVGAIIVIAFDAEESVAVSIAGGDQ